MSPESAQDGDPAIVVDLCDVAGALPVAIEGCFGHSYLFRCGRGIADPKKPSRWRRFDWFLERAVNAADNPGSAGYQSERFRADLYNGTNGGSR